MDVVLVSLSLCKPSREQYSLGDMRYIGVDRIQLNSLHLWEDSGWVQLYDNHEPIDISTCSHQVTWHFYCEAANYKS